MSRSLLLDTMVLSAVLRKEPVTQQRLALEIAQNATVLVSPVVYFELRRGLLKKDAQRLLQYLDVIIAPLLWIDVTRGDWETAASLWAKTQRAGHPIEDADLIIAAQANRRDAVVVTDNVRHFRPIAGALETWS
jgi:tRNA(fMet)-specific endonuclease VapC